MIAEPAEHLRGDQEDRRPLRVRSGERCFVDEGNRASSVSRALDRAVIRTSVLMRFRLIASRGSASPSYQFKADRRTPRHPRSVPRPGPTRQDELELSASAKGTMHVSLRSASSAKPTRSRGAQALRRRRARRRCASRRPSPRSRSMKRQGRRRGPDQRGLPQLERAARTSEPGPEFLEQRARARRARTDTMRSPGRTSESGSARRSGIGCFRATAPRPTRLPAARKVSSNSRSSDATSSSTGMQSPGGASRRRVDHVGEADAPPAARCRSLQRQRSPSRTRCPPSSRSRSRCATCSGFPSVCR